MPEEITQASVAAWPRSDCRAELALRLTDPTDPDGYGDADPDDGAAALEDRDDHREAHVF